MSNRATSWAWDVEDLSPTQKLVLVKLADNANDDGYCWPSRSYLMKHTCLSDGAVKGAIRELERKRLVSVIRRKVEERVNLPNHYQLEMRGGAGDARPLGQEMPGGGSPDAHKPSIEPPLEPRDSSSAEKPSSRDIERAFNDQFWAAYPRHVGKGAARAKFIAQAKKNGVEVIMAGLARAIGEWKRQGTEAQFIPHPATWLNQERWEDEPLSQSAARKGNHIDNDPAFSGWGQPAGWTPENDTYRPSGNSGNGRDNVDPAFTGWN